MLLRAYDEGTGVTTNENTVVIDHSSANQLLHISTTISVQGLACNARNIVLWNEKQINVHSILESDAGPRVQLLSEIQVPSGIRSLSLANETLLVTSDKHLFMMSPMGIQQGGTTSISDSEGSPLVSNAMNNNLVVVTQNGYLKVFDVNNTQTPIRQQFSKNLHEVAGLDALGKLISVKCNAAASLVSFVSRHDYLDKLFVYNTLRDELKLVRSDDAGTLSCCWDPAEPRLLACSAKARDNHSAFTTLYFVCEEEGGVYQYEIISHSPSSALMGIEVPYVVFAQEDGKLLNQTITDFIDLEDESPLALAAMLDFSFYNKLGNIDKSFESLQAVTSPRVWAKVAPFCINVKRSDLAELCLSHIASTEGLATFQLAKKEPEVEVALAVAAVQFGLHEQAQQLYKECNRHDLLNQLLQNIGQRDDVLKVAEVDDRANLDLKRHIYDRFFDSSGELDKAVGILGKYAKKSTKFKQLVRERRIDDLECFVGEQNDKELYAWLGELYQSLGNYAKAYDHYILAGDDLKLVELYCSEGNFQEAEKIVYEGGNTAAAHYMARFYSGTEAVKFYTLCGMYNQAIRIAMSNGLDSDLFDIAQKCNPDQASECARYFENKGMLSHAFRLYVRSDEKPKALAMCLILLDEEGEDKEASDLFLSLVKSMDTPLPPDLSQQILKRLQHSGETELMFELMCSDTKDAQTCLRFCSDYSIELTEQIVSKIITCCTTDEESNDLLHILARKCNDQGSYKLSSRLYSRCGDFKAALKCLAKEGDPDAIISYANDRQAKSLYGLAASCLQKMDLHQKDNSVEKSIIEFYRKAEKYDKLVTYLISLSQSAVEHHGNYETAIIYLKEASIMSKNLKGSSVREIESLISERLSTIEWFQYAQETYKSMDRLSLEDLCLDLMSPHQFNQIVRAGDCYALLVNYFFDSDQFQTAHDYLQAMEERDLNPYDFVERHVIKKVLHAIGDGGSSDDDESR